MRAPSVSAASINGSTPCSATARHRLAGGLPCSITSERKSSPAAIAMPVLTRLSVPTGPRMRKKILSAVYRSGERFGAAHVIDILCGTQTEKITRTGHHRLPTFGISAARGKNEWRLRTGRYSGTAPWIDLKVNISS